MKSKLLDEQNGARTYAVILETGDEVSNTLKTFAMENKLHAGSMKAIGALSDAKLGWFNWETKQYQVAADLHEQLEVLSLIGDVAIYEGKPVVHAHMVVGKRDGTAHGGHLMEAHVRPTLEVILTESPVHLRKVLDPESGIPLIRP